MEQVFFGKVNRKTKRSKDNVHKAREDLLLYKMVERGEEKKNYGDCLRRKESRKKKLIRQMRKIAYTWRRSERVNKPK